MKKALMIALSLIFVAGCKSLLDEIKETPSMTDSPQYSIEEVEKIARIEIPAAAYDIQVDADTGWMDDAAIIKFKISPHELEPFLEQYGFDNLQQGFWSIQDDPTLEWWPSYNSKWPRENYIGGQFNFPEYFQNILIDITNPGEYVVYFQCFEH